MLDNLVVSLSCIFSMWMQLKKQLVILALIKVMLVRSKVSCIYHHSETIFFYFRSTCVALTFKCSLFQGLVVEPPDINTVQCKMFLKITDVFYGTSAVSGTFSRFFERYFLTISLVFYVVLAVFSWNRGSRNG